MLGDMIMLLRSTSLGMETGEFIRLAGIRCDADNDLSPFGSISFLYQTTLDCVTKCGDTEPLWTYLRPIPIGE